MIRKIGVAALLGLLATGALATSAGAQCGTGPIIVLNSTGTFGFETPGAVAAPYISPVNNSLSVVGLIQLFCAPFADLDALDPTTEYTIVISGLTSGGSTHPIPSLYVTNYSGGTFTIYSSSPRNSPTNAAGMPAASSGSLLTPYTDGTAILSGTLSGFYLQVTTSGAGTYNATATYTGGTLYSRVTGQSSLLTGTVCTVSGCLPGAGGYSAQFDTGKFDTPVTPNLKSTWGSLKLLYR
jgi:hypothetical protein